MRKGARIAGLADDQIRSIAVDENLRMRPDALVAAIDTDRADGLTPFFVCATAGTTSTLAFDPLDPIGAITEERGLWLHVDAAMAGSAAVCPELRWVHAGLERADSYVQPAQVAAHDLRLRRLLRHRPSRAHRGAAHHAALPPQRGE